MNPVLKKIPFFHWFIGFFSLIYWVFSVVHWGFLQWFIGFFQWFIWFFQWFIGFFQWFIGVFYSDLLGFFSGSLGFFSIIGVVFLGLYGRKAHPAVHRGRIHAYTVLGVCNSSAPRVHSTVRWQDHRLLVSVLPCFNSYFMIKYFFPSLFRNILSMQHEPMYLDQHSKNVTISGLCIGTLNFLRVMVWHFFQCSIDWLIDWLICFFSNFKKSGISKISLFSRSCVWFWSQCRSWWPVIRPTPYRPVTAWRTFSLRNGRATPLHQVGSKNSFFSIFFNFFQFFSKLGWLFYSFLSGQWSPGFYFTFYSFSTHFVSVITMFCVVNMACNVLPDSGTFKFPLWFVSLVFISFIYSPSLIWFAIFCPCDFIFSFFYFFLLFSLFFYFFDFWLFWLFFIFNFLTFFCF